VTGKGSAEGRAAFSVSVSRLLLRRDTVYTRRLRRTAALCALAAIATLVARSASAQDVSPTAPPISVRLGERPAIRASEALLVDLTDNGQVLFSRNTRERRAPASLTKVVTALVARDQFDLNETVVTDEHVRIAQGTMGIVPGMHFSVRDLLYAMMLPSSNDAAAAIAAHDPNGYPHFVRLMNEKARALGARGTNFANPHGLDEAGHVSTAWDMAIFARQLLDDPVLAEIVRTKHYNLRWPADGKIRVLTNHNYLLGRYPGMVGMKTGYTVRAGRSLISAVRTEQSLLVLVLMNSPNLYGETGKLLDYGKAIELGTEGGGGGPALPASHLSRPPAPPSLNAQGIRLSTAPLTKDPRDQPLWTMLLSALTTLTAAMLVVRRRRSRLQEAAEFYPSLRSLVSDSRN
jgi:D-alanyl-D-alanine carboxypeptidase (penicillin-binding protein 5/6)